MNIGLRFTLARLSRDNKLAFSNVCKNKLNCKKQRMKKERVDEDEGGLRENGEEGVKKCTK